MALRVYPRDTIDMVVGEECAYGLIITKELKTKTVASYTYKLYNNSEVEVTDTFGGGNSIADGIITFGIKAVSKGKYSLQFIITCNELLPDATTPYEFYVDMTVQIT